MWKRFSSLSKCRYELGTCALTFSLDKRRQNESLELAERLKGVCPRWLDQWELLLLQAFSSQHCSPFSLWISAVLQLHTYQACSFHLGLTLAYLTSERSSLNVFLPLSGPRRSPSLLRHSLSGRTVTKGKPLFPILSGVGDPNFREEKNLRIIANEAKGCINGPTRRTDFLVQL